jgi:hypothetical protein
MSDVVAGSSPAGGWVSAHDLTRTVICARPGCDEVLEPGAGEGDLCLGCRIRLRDRPGRAQPGKRRADEIEPPAADTEAPAEPPAETAEPPAFTCQTPGCDGKATSSWGRHAFCRSCQIKRGTRNPDGTLVLGKTPRQEEARRGKARRSRPAPAPASAATAAGKRAGKRPDSARRHPESPGATERALLELVDLARRVDGALAGLETARAEAEEARSEWQSALARLRNGDG